MGHVTKNHAIPAYSLSYFGYYLLWLIWNV